MEVRILSLALFFSVQIVPDAPRTVVLLSGVLKPGVVMPTVLMADVLVPVVCVGLIGFWPGLGSVVSVSDWVLWL